MAAGARGALPTDWRAEQTRLSAWLQPMLAGDSVPEALAPPLARWELLRRVGPEALSALSNEPAFLDALWNDPPRLEKFLSNATAHDRADAALALWAQLWNAETPARRAKYDNLMLAIALKWDGAPGQAVSGDFALDASGAIVITTHDKMEDPKHLVTTRLTAAGRYQWYRDAWEAGRLYTDVAEFEPWELKYAVNTYRRDEDLEWALGAMHDRNPAFFKKSRAEVRREWGHNTPWMVPYTWDMINKGFGNMSTALDVMAKGGFVCGGQSDFAQATAQAHGIPAAKQGGPGHGWMAWKPAPDAAWDPTGNGGYSPSNSSYRDDWYEDGDHSQARLQCYGLPELHGAALAKAERGFSMAGLARQLGDASAERRWLVLAVRGAGANPYAVDRALERFNQLKGATPADWTPVVAAANDALLKALPDEFYDVLGAAWRLEQAKVLDTLPPAEAAARLAQRRDLLIDMLPERSDLLLHVVQHELAYEKRAGGEADLAAHLTSVLHGATSQGPALALGQVLCDMQRGEPARYDAAATDVLRRVAEVPVTDVGARAATLERLAGPAGQFGFGAGVKLGAWDASVPAGGATKEVSFDLAPLRAAFPAAARGDATLRLLFVPRGGPHFLKVEKLGVRLAGSEAAKHEPAFEVHPESGPLAVSVDVPALGDGPAALAISWHGTGGHQFSGDILGLLESRPDWASAVGVGGTGPEQFAKSLPFGTWREVTVADLTPQIVAGGTLDFEIRYASYAATSYAWLRLYADGAPVAEDLHAGNCRWGDYARRFRLNLASYDPHAKYTLHCLEQKSDGWSTIVMAPQLRRVAKWTPKDVSATGANLDYDVTARVRATGEYVVKLDFTKGKHALSATKVALLADGREVAADVHPCFSGTRKEHTVYRLTVGQVAAGAKYTLRVVARGEGGTDSAGDVWLKTP